MSRSSQLSQDRLTETVRLSLISGVGPRTRVKLLERFGSPEAVLQAASAELREVSGVGPKLCRAIATARDEIDAVAEIEMCRASGIEIIS